jgi:hypothetical protein
VLAVFRLVGQLNDWAFERESKEEETDASVDFCGKIAVDLIMADRLPVSILFLSLRPPLTRRKRRLL